MKQKKFFGKLDTPWATAPLTQPKQTHPIGGDGNCMFRAVSYVITGSQEHHLEVRANTLEHMETIAPLVLGHIRGRSGAAMSKYSGVNEYIQYTINHR